MFDYGFKKIKRIGPDSACEAKGSSTGDEGPRGKGLRVHRGEGTGG